MKKLTALLFVMVMLTLPAHAQQKTKKQQEPILWNGLRYGMTVKEVKKKMPDIILLEKEVYKSRELLDFNGYEFEKYFGFKNGKLTEVDLVSNQTGPKERMRRYYVQLLTSLGEKYGQIDINGNNIWETCNNFCDWRNAGTLISLRNDPNEEGDYRVSIIYTSYDAAVKENKERERKMKEAL